MHASVKKTTTQQRETIGKSLLRSAEKDRSKRDAEFKQWLKAKEQKGAPTHA